MRHLFERLFTRKKTSSAAVAKERLQIIVSHERAKRSSPEFISKLQQELVNVIAKYVHINPNDVKETIASGDLEKELLCGIMLTPEVSIKIGKWLITHWADRVDSTVGVVPNDPYQLSLGRRRLESAL